MTGLSFEEIWAEQQNVHPDALRVGVSFASYIPPPSQAYGLWEAARWWTAIGRLIPLGRGTDESWAKKANPSLLGRGWSVQDVASQRLDQIDAWWGMDRWANVGFPTKANRIVIADLDPRHGGEERWAELCEAHGFDWSCVPRSASPAMEGGQHLWFRTDVDYPHSPLARGVDRPWQVPVPPSARPVVTDPTAKGSRARRTTVLPYTWVAGDPRVLPEAPAWLVGERLDAPAGGAGGGDGGDSIELPRTDSGAIDTEAVAAVPEGSQSLTFKRVMCSMIRQKYSDLQILAKIRAMAAASPQRPEDPWTEEDFEYMLHKAHDYLERQTREEQERNASIIAHSFPRRWRP